MYAPPGYFPSPMYAPLPPLLTLLNGHSEAHRVRTMLEGKSGRRRWRPPVVQESAGSLIEELQAASYRPPANGSRWTCGGIRQFGRTITRVPTLTRS